MEKTHINWAVLFCLCLGLVSCSSHKGSSDSLGEPLEQDSVAEAAVIDPRADRLLRDMGEYLKSRKIFSLEIDVVQDEVLGSGQRIQFGRHSRALVKRPDKLWAKVEGDRRQGELFYNGAEVTLVDSRAKHYAVVKAPSDIDSTLDFLVDEYDFSLPLADLFFSDAYEVLRAEIYSGRYLGIRKVRGVKCHHLAFQQENVDWQLWVSDDKKPLPMKFVITYKLEEGIPQFAAVLSKWKFARSVRESKFTFKAAKGFEKIELLPVGESHES